MFYRGRASRLSLLIWVSWVPTAVMVEPSKGIAQALPERFDYDSALQTLESMSQGLDRDFQELQALSENLAELEREIEALDREIEAINPGYRDRMGAYESHLASCSPAEFEDLFLPNTLETIRGWQGENCRVDMRITLAGEPQLMVCFYPRQQLAALSPARTSAQSSDNRPKSLPQPHCQSGQIEP